MKATDITDGHRKRARTSQDTDETSASKRARGRPRVDTQDATAADVSGFLRLQAYRVAIHQFGSDASYV